MTDEAKKARAEYNRAYREKNRERINEYHRKWNRENRDRIKKYNSQMWERKAEGGEG